MKKGFYTIMSAQFFSSLADNALFIAAVELLRPLDATGSQRASLVPMFALFYVLLAPFVGAFADSRPKGQVMLISNAIKVLGCLLMLAGLHPLLAFAVVGLGAAAYSPAKYGILTELLPPSQLVKANGWIEGLTIASIILGVLVGGQLVGPHLSPYLLALNLPGVHQPAEAALAVLVLVYGVAAAFNLRIPRTDAPLQPMHNPFALVQDFRQCNRRLWKDKLGQISLATTTLFWGVSGNLRYIVLAWAAAALGYSVTQASNLVGVVAVGTAIGALVASWSMQLDKAVKVIPLGIGMGLLILLLNVIDNVWLAAPFLVLLGALGGFLVVPMNALLQHRGHNLMGAGRSIAVQNFNEQACILGLGLLYASLTHFGLSAFAAISAFGLVVACIMELIRRWHASNLRWHPAEVERLLQIARSDPGH
ncbi:lysophospholipid transporter LplT [Inhella sp.]|uniref:lysophospholipid transporter LplT n=1 Tax=Inhella sp. TaxID=1921806 RepID=UPI0035B4EB9D